MKKLQNNFTTPEQSKRLLELGVPADSADCALLLNKNANKYEYIVINNQDDYNFMDDNTLPCWSVGRLMEILGICAGMECVDFETLAWTEGILSEKLIILTEDLAKYDKLDFSKLEE